MHQIGNTILKEYLVTVKKVLIMELNVLDMMIVAIGLLKIHGEHHGEKVVSLH